MTAAENVLKVYLHKGLKRVCVQRQLIPGRGKTWVWRSDLNGIWMPCVSGHPTAGVFEVPVDPPPEPAAPNTLNALTFVYDPTPVDGEHLLATMTAALPKEGDVVEIPTSTGPVRVTYGPRVPTSDDFTIAYKVTLNNDTEQASESHG